MRFNAHINNVPYLFIINGLINNSLDAPRMFTLQILLSMSTISLYTQLNFTTFLFFSSGASSNGQQPFGANKSVEVAAAGLFVANMQADPPQLNATTPFALPPTTSSSDRIPADEESDVIKLDDGDIRGLEDENAEEEIEEKVVDIVLAEGWSPILYK